MWNDRDIPIAYLITFRCYGTWLPGEDRGTIDRVHNRYKTPYGKPDEPKLKRSLRRLKSAPFKLDGNARRVVETSIGNVCKHKKWALHAINVRTNHIHTVVSIGIENPSKALNSFKSYSTRNLKEDKIWKNSHSPWARRGSKRFIWNEQHLEVAIDYVVNGQGIDLPQFT